MSAVKTALTELFVTFQIITGTLKRELWLGDEILGTLEVSGGRWHARTGTTKVATTEGPHNGIRAILGATFHGQITRVIWQPENLEGDVRQEVLPGRSSLFEIGGQPAADLVAPVIAKPVEANKKPTKAKPSSAVSAKEYLTASSEPVEGGKGYKLVIKLGDRPIGHLVPGSNPEALMAYIGHAKVHQLAPLGIAVEKLLEAAGYDANEITKLKNLRMAGGSLVKIGGQPAKVLEPTLAELGVGVTSATVTGLQSIALEQIKADESVQSRAQLDMITISEYQEALQNGTQSLPPITVFFDGAVFWLADGFHRLAAHKAANREEIACEVTLGSKRDAVLHSAVSNQSHGLRRTNLDKRRAIEMLLHDAEWRTWTDRHIATLIGVDGKTVATVREALEAAGQIAAQPVRKSASGAATSAKKSSKPSTGQPLDLEPSASLEHGKTSKPAKGIKLGAIYVSPSSPARSAAGEYIDNWTLKASVNGETAKLGEVWHGAKKEICGRVDLEGFENVRKRGAFVLSALTWPVAVLEVLGEITTVSVDTKIYFLDHTGATIGEPPINLTGKATPTTPALEPSEPAAAEDTANAMAGPDDGLQNLVLDLHTALVALLEPGTTARLKAALAGNGEARVLFEVIVDDLDRVCGVFENALDEAD